MRKIIINGIRGIPASHGGFETFAEYLALFLVKRGWLVTVYCQGDPGTVFSESNWKGVKLITIPESNTGAFGTVRFDLRAVLDSLKRDSLVLTLGYNTAIFNSLYRLFGIPNVINMDGIEWKRDKWGAIAKTWFWLNERFGCWFGNRLIADHPEIARHLYTRVKPEKVTTIAYGGLEVTSSDVTLLKPYNLDSKEYAIVIARPEPENSLLEIVKGFSSKKRNKNLVILGKYDTDNDYHKKVMDAASSEVIFLGAIYDISVVSALRFYSVCYVHGHTVGGTNPSLVESLGTGNAIIAHDNKFNRWVAKDGALYFKDDSDISAAFDIVFSQSDVVERLSKATLENFNENFQWDDILMSYESVLSEFVKVSK
ncbi:MAG: glycosyltransferase family 1 protein [Pseudoalteromonas sp.]|nr:glycosyltransferase family 1 protein [Pseudoalteromonas sp.]